MGVQWKPKYIVTDRPAGERKATVGGACTTQLFKLGGSALYLI